MQIDQQVFIELFHDSQKTGSCPQKAYILMVETTIKDAHSVDGN